MSKVFLTGATGFIGGNLVEKLLEAGYEVKVLIRNKKLLESRPWKDKVEIILGDILKPETFSQRFNDCEYIIHGAAIIEFWNKKWDKVYKINVIGTRNVLEEALKSNIKKFVHISSVAAIGYGEAGEIVDESQPYNWDKHKICYMETKHEAEKEVFNAIKKGLVATIVNPANVWGRGDYRGRRVPAIKVIRLGQPFYIEAGSNFVDVDAVCEAIVNAIEYGRIGERYILGGDNLTIKEFLDTIASEIGVRKPFIKLPKLPIVLFSYTQEALGLITKISPKPAPSQLCLFNMKSFYDSSKAIKELKMPVIPFSECIHKAVRFYKEHNLL